MQADEQWLHQSKKKLTMTVKFVDFNCRHDDNAE
jgi:hypothetical protein